ncbi:MAG: hypothetical protein II992_09920 [Lachnospiraceae bacterium]|nr:hypothetical protein [Lachnospiraceae bacterium]
MKIFIPLGIGILFLFLTGIIIAIDNRIRRNRRKKIPLVWKIIGIAFLIISIANFVYFSNLMSTFDGEEYGDRKTILRSTMLLSDVTIPSGDASLDKNLQEAYEEVLKGLEEGNTDISISYVDALLNKKQISLDHIHEVKYSEDLNANQVQIVEYFVVEKDGYFTRPGIYYYITFGQELLEKQEDEKKVSSKKNKNKKE